MSTLDLEETLEGTYEALLEQATNPRQRITLERIKAACDYLDAHKMKISPTTVERYCLDRDWDGPKAQSIRNSKDVLMRYLLVRQSGQQFRERPKQSSEPEIADESLRAYVQLLKEERDQAVADRTRIQAGLRKIPGISVDDLIRGTLSAPRADAAPVGVQAVSPELVKVIAVLFDEERLRACGLELAKGRLRQATTKTVLLEKAEVEALEKLLQGS
ncbi:hypothetical protein BLA13014_00369 [Burkholderia aenigmatica]|uniref:Uncharacterized protein n=2 Tax=Burkholderia cepacia complex TaxID=87882 RepID=A0A6P2HA16_9BURK|nr:MULTISPECIES: hypothetical protein [Burkholderia]KVK86163.1 hypothetical protein WS90_07745 [Burkholderia cepacia]KWC58100.1 hypothetical protein WL54_19045 [Burkholderia ubonensis]VWB14145.1 hypothetical protein BLA13014_00369 [Burkholderia aenigmatica]